MTQHPKPIKITDATKAKFKPAIDATSATLQSNNSKHWTGEASLALYGDTLRDISALAVTSRNSYCVPPGSALHVLSSIPMRMHLAACRLISEGLPAIRNSSLVVPKTDAEVKSILQSFNTHMQPLLMKLHQIMQYECEQIREVQEWTGCSGLLIDSALLMKTHFHVVAATCRELAPDSNWQSRMVAQEASMYFSDLQGTLKRLAS